MTLRYIWREKEKKKSWDIIFILFFFNSEGIQLVIATQKVGCYIYKQVFADNSA